MSLTRPRIQQIDTTITAFTDPITVIHAGSTQANVDMGFLYNRANGLVSNVALYWSEAGNTFVTAFTSNSGATDSNIAVSQYANLTVGTLTADSLATTGNLYVGGNLTVANLITVNQEVVTTTEIIQGNTVANSGTASTDTTTGALVVRGGAGISGDLNLGGNITITGNITPSANITYSLGTTTNRFKDLWLSGTTIYIGGASIGITDGNLTLTNPEGGSFSVTGSAPGQSTANFGNVVANSAVESTSTTTGAIVVTGGLGVSGNIFAGNIYATNAMVDRGSDQLNWDTLTTMGIYLVNRVSWSGVTGAPLDTTNYTGVLEVVNSGNMAIVQNYRPYTTATIANVYWTRTQFNGGSWTTWQEIINGQGYMDGGSF